MRSERKRRGAWNTIFSIFGGTLVFGVLVFAVASMLSHQRFHTVRQSWERSLGTLDDILAQYPPWETNASALEIEELVARLGGDLAPRRAEDRAHPTREAARAGGVFKRDAGAYVAAQLALSSSEVEAAPEPVATFLAEHAEEIDAIAARIVEGPGPRWESAPERLTDAPIPNLMGHLDIQRVFLARALQRIALGDDAGALRDLDAAWVLAASVRENPILISQLVGISTSRRLIGALRHVESAPDVWRERLASLDPLRSVLVGIQYESWVWTEVDHSASHGPGSDTLSRLVMNVAGPYVRYCAAEVSEAVRLQLELVTRLDYVCDRDLTEIEAGLRVTVPRWNFLGLYVPDLSGAIERAVRLELDLELTEKLLALRATRRDNGGVWPASPREIDRSDTCPEDRWIYDRASGSEMSLALSRTPVWSPSIRGPRMPLSYGTASMGRTQLPSR